MMHRTDAPTAVDSMVDSLDKIRTLTSHDLIWIAQNGGRRDSEPFFDDRGDPNYDGSRNLG